LRVLYIAGSVGKQLPIVLHSNSNNTYNVNDLVNIPCIVRNWSFGNRSNSRTFRTLIDLGQTATTEKETF